MGYGMTHHHHKHDDGKECCAHHYTGEGMEGTHHWGAKKKKPLAYMTMKVAKNLLKKKIEAEIDSRYGEQLDTVAKDMVDLMSEKMKMKTNMIKKKMEMKEKMMMDIKGIFDMEEEE
jgi:hypothetical protein